MTDLRVWACQRSEEDIKMMMYEYLKDAEMKRKLKVNIRKGGKKNTAGGGGLLKPPPIRLPQPESKRGFALAPPPESPSRRTGNLPVATSNSPGGDGMDADFTPTFADFSSEMVDKAPVVEKVEESINLPEDVVKSDEREEEDNAAVEPPELNSPEVVEAEAPQDQEEDPVPTEGEEEEPINSPFVVTVSDLLSTHVRKSAAAAIVRGPPASRHFGGNRGGLLSNHVNFGNKRDGVSPIAICGADKSVVWFSDRDPPGCTFPIGASGAVLSDIMDEDQSEYICCFLAKEKRMVVFELSRKTVVVELQMKTKLNFWRYLPPEAHGSELAFVLITPIGKVRVSIFVSYYFVCSIRILGDLDTSFGLY